MGAGRGIFQVPAAAGWLALFLHAGSEGPVIFGSACSKTIVIFDLRGIDREKGALVVVRPDQYVSHILPLDAHDELSAFFGQFLLDRH